MFFRIFCALLYAAASVVATHYSPAGYIYAAVMPSYRLTMSFFGADPSTASEAKIGAEAPTPAETKLPTPTPAELESQCQYQVCFSYIFKF